MPQLDLYIWLTNSNLFLMFFLFFYFYVIMYLLVPLCKLFYMRQFFMNVISSSETSINKHLQFISVGLYSNQLIALFNKLNSFLKKESLLLRLYVKYKFLLEYLNKNISLNNYMFFLIKFEYLNSVKKIKNIVI